MRPNRIPLRWKSNSQSWHQVFSPNDQSLLGEIQRIDKDDLELIPARLKEGQKSLSRVPAHQRAKWLKDTAASLRKDLEQVAVLIATEGGKPLKDARIEAARAAQTFELCAEEALRLGGEVLPMERTPAGAGHLAFTLYEPIGPVLALSAFNHPMNLLAHQVGTALAAGCAVAFKPSSCTPFCAEWLADTLTVCGVPADVALLFHADSKDSEKLAGNPIFQFVSFIGSAKVGWELRRKIAAGTRVAMEHGGQAPAIVWDDADVDAAVKALVKGGYYHAGQVCISTQKIFVHEKIYSVFTAAFTEAVRNLKVGSATEENTDVGPLITAEEKKRVQDWIQQAVTAGAKVNFQSEELGGNYVPPTVLSEVPTDCKVWKDEVFGPVVCVNSFADINQVYEALAENPFHFEAAVFTASLARSLEAIRELSAMTVVVNNHTAVRVDEMPFGGHRLAGLGMGGVRWAVEEQSRLKQVLINGFKNF